MRNRNNRIQVRLNESEYEKFIKSVRKSKLPQETYLRAILKGYQLVESSPFEYYDLLKEPRAVGRLMDQIVSIIRLMDMLSGKSKTIRDHEGQVTEEELKRLDKSLESLEAFMAASETFGKMKKVIDVADETFHEICVGLDSIFGSGVCDAFLQGEMDVDYFKPLINAVSPYFKKARDKQVSKYKAKK